ncbi:DUF4844 domain-containing protein [Zavarzinia aquatilis]|uniref:Uncharacterized protein n=1 Tax=Zavarzinia aquatilis TaxID=2211142 RepID=A0A317EFV4_9PROT|nr:DUF4844 domain-containing protein [Zavarzinia aquatilis]PWR25897.1 hypothetical protein DKG74_02800 [Zavarzinia aquatilis]
MRNLIIFLVIAILLAGGAAGWWLYARSFPPGSQENVLLTPEKRQALERLRHEDKFKPHDYPPLGYTGIATPEEGAIAQAAVNDAIDAILLFKDESISAESVSDLIGRAMSRVRLLETEDRDRAANYMIEIWYILGFKGATGQFAYGAAFQRPAGYSEPLPPGWKSPTEPRQIDQP